MKEWLKLLWKDTCLEDVSIEFVKWDRYASTNYFKIITEIEPNVDDFFSSKVLNFPFHIFFSNLLKFKIILSYFRIDFFDLYYTDMIDHEMNLNYSRSLSRKQLVLNLAFLWY